MTAKCFGMDLEISNVFQDFVSWRSYRPLDITCIAVAPSDKTGIVFSGTNGNVMTTAEVRKAVYFMQDMLRDGYTCVTWNGLGFDWVVLSDASGLLQVCRDMVFSNQHVDMMFAMFMALGYGVGLGTACMETIGRGKLGSGAEAPRLFAQERHQELFDYNLEDATLTKDLYMHLYAMNRPLIKWRTRSGAGVLKQLAATNTWSPIWSVPELIDDCPVPQVASFMDNPPTLEDYLSLWMNGGAL